jgi:effector-binding domain-containing protein
MSQFDALEFAEVEVPAVEAAQMPGECGPDPAAISGAMRAAFERLRGFLQQHKLTPAGPPRAIYSAYGPQGVRFTVAMPIAGTPAAKRTIGPGFIKPLAAAKAMRFTHRGPYADLMKTYGLITEFLKAKDRMQTEADWARFMPMWEEYLNDPRTTPEADLRTYICPQYRGPVAMDMRKHVAAAVIVALAFYACLATAAVVWLGLDADPGRNSLRSSP